MIEKIQDDSLLDGFDVFTNEMSGPGENRKSVINGDDEINNLSSNKTVSPKNDIDIDPEDVFVEAEKLRESKSKQKPVEEEIEEDPKENTAVQKEKTVQKTTPVETSVNVDDEAELIEPFVDLFTQELGWELDENEKPKSIKDLVEYMQDIVETNSKPEFANNEIEELNEFVKNGGDLKDFYQKVYSEVDVDNIDIDDERNQKRVIRELLESKGFNRNRIDRMITRYEDSDTLSAEAEDAIEELKELREQTKQNLLKQQEEENTRALEERRQFYTKIDTDIKTLNNIKGYDLTKKDKQELLDYIFKVENDGTTKYQKDYSKSHMNLIESAFFTMKGDKLLKAAETRGSNNATQMLKDRLRSKSNLAKNTASADENEVNSDMWSMLDSTFKQPTR